jgi:ABC-type Fe3+-hydroxamate transport system substrate-binding protein
MIFLSRAATLLFAIVVVTAPSCNVVTAEGLERSFTDDSGVTHTTTKEKPTIVSMLTFVTIRCSEGIDR